MRHFKSDIYTCQCQTVHQTSLFHIESNLLIDRLGLISQGQTSIPRFMMVEVLSWCSWRASQHPAVQSLVLPPRGPDTSFLRLVFWSRDEGLAVIPRVAPPISRSRSESGAYSRAPPVLVPSPLKTVWFVDSTGSTPPSTSGMLLTGHSMPGLLTVSSLPREAARAVRNTVPA